MPISALPDLVPAHLASLRPLRQLPASPAPPAGGPEVMAPPHSAPARLAVPATPQLPLPAKLAVAEARLETASARALGQLGWARHALRLGMVAGAALGLLVCATSGPVGLLMPVLGTLAGCMLQSLARAGGRPAFQRLLAAHAQLAAEAAAAGITLTPSASLAELAAFHGRNAQGDLRHELRLALTPLAGIARAALAPFAELRARALRARAERADGEAATPLLAEPAEAATPTPAAAPTATATTPEDVAESGPTHASSPQLDAALAAEAQRG